MYVHVRVCVRQVNLPFVHKSIFACVFCEKAEFVHIYGCTYPCVCEPARMHTRPSIKHYKIGSTFVCVCVCVCVWTCTCTCLCFASAHFVHAHSQHSLGTLPWLFSLTLQTSQLPRSSSLTLQPALFPLLTAWQLFSWGNLRWHLWGHQHPRPSRSPRSSAPPPPSLPCPHSTAKLTTTQL